MAASANDNGRVDEPVKGSDVGGVVTTVAGGIVAKLVVEPCGTTGIEVVVPASEVDVELIVSDVVVGAGMLVDVVGTVVDSATVVEVVGIVDVVVLVEVVSGVQSETSCVSCADPCGCPKNVQFVLASIVWAPAATVIMMMSTAVGPVNWKSRWGPCTPSIKIDSCAVTDVCGNSA